MCAIGSPARVQGVVKQPVCEPLPASRAEADDEHFAL